VQAAVLRVKLRHLDQDNRLRQTVANIYNEQLTGTGIALPQTLSDRTHVYHQYVISSSRRDQIQAHLRSHGIGTAIHYPAPVHLQPAYKGRLLPKGIGLSNTEQLCGEILSLPMYPQLSQFGVRRVCDVITR